MLVTDLVAPVAHHGVVRAIDAVGPLRVADPIDLPGGASAEIVARLARIDLAPAIAGLGRAVANDTSGRLKGAAAPAPTKSAAAETPPPKVLPNGSPGTPPQRVPEPWDGEPRPPRELPSVTQPERHAIATNGPIKRLMPRCPCFPFQGDVVTMRSTCKAELRERWRWIA